MTDKEKDCRDCKHYCTDYDCREFCESRDMFEPNKKIKKMTNQEAIEVLKLNNPFMAGKDKETFSKAIDKGIEALENQKTGHWIEGQRNNLEIHNILCSNCLGGYSSKGHANSQYTRERFKFCPNCGAKMEGE